MMLSVASRSGVGRGDDPSNSTRPLTRRPVRNATLNPATSVEPTLTGTRAQRVGTVVDAAGMPLTMLGRGIRVTCNSYCPDGTPRNVKAPEGSLIVFAVGKFPLSAASRLSAT